MAQCKQCGTELPDHARFCLQCGAPVQVEEPDQQEQPQPEPRADRPPPPLPELDFVQPAAMGGMFLGMLSSLPIIAAGNIFCCMWVLLGGAIATFY